MNFRDQVISIVDAFNVEDLDRVMQFFSESAEYVTFDGKCRKGLVEIRTELKPQFEGRYGKLQFITDKLMIDETNNMAAVSWRCEHSLRDASSSFLQTLVPKVLSLALGKKPYWEGVDLFQFKDGKITGKYTYSQSRLPLLRR